MEVDTPALSQFATVDPHIDSFVVTAPGGGERRYLHTSPEFAMKRLLAAGSGDIYQLSHVFRVGESGRYHNSEFMLLEWYRTGWHYRQLIDEVGELLQRVGLVALATVDTLDYRQLFMAKLTIDPVAATDQELQQLAEALSPKIDLTALRLSRSGWLDWLFSQHIQPQLGGEGRAVALIRYPASQASLAQLEPNDSAVAQRFEIFYRGVELANGFGELTDAVQQRQRFEAEWRQRRDEAKPLYPIDQHLLAALAQGLPECSGVAVGVDRLLMQLSESDQIDQVLSFGWRRA